jgi:hypothetical protein
MPPPLSSSPPRLLAPARPDVADLQLLRSPSSTSPRPRFLSTATATRRRARPATSTTSRSAAPERLMTLQLVPGVSPSCTSPRSWPRRVKYSDVCDPASKYSVSGRRPLPCSASLPGASSTTAAGRVLLHQNRSRPSSTSSALLCTSSSSPECAGPCPASLSVHLLRLPPEHVGVVIQPLLRAVAKISGTSSTSASSSPSFLARHMLHPLHPTASVKIVVLRQRSSRSSRLRRAAMHCTSKPCASLLPDNLALASVLKYSVRASSWPPSSSSGTYGQRRLSSPSASERSAVSQHLRPRHTSQAPALHSFNTSASPKFT